MLSTRYCAELRLACGDVRHGQHEKDVVDTGGKGNVGCFWTLCWGVRAGGKPYVLGRSGFRFLKLGMTTMWRELHGYWTKSVRLKLL